MTTTARTLRPMAKAWVGRDHRGNLVVFGEGTVEGERRQRRKRIPKDDQTLADEVARELNGRFIRGDLSWLEQTPRKARRKPRPRAPRCPTLTEWSGRWIERMKPPAISGSTWANYDGSRKDLVARLGELHLDEIDLADVRKIERDMQREGRHDSTIGDRVGLLRRMMRDARIEGVTKNAAVETPLPRSQTKRRRREQRSKRVTFRPFAAEEMSQLLAVLRDPDPKKSNEVLYFPVTEALLLTGLRWEEASGWIWPDVSLSADLIHVQRANTRYSKGDLDEPTKTGLDWHITIREPLRALLLRQRAVSRAGRPNGWVFPSKKGTPLGYRNWLSRGWNRALERAKVTPREGDAQKALRRSYLISGLVCGRNPKELSAEVGHTSLRMLLSTYDAFIDPANWPDENQRAQLRGIYGWPSSGQGGDRENHLPGGTQRISVHH